MGYDIRPDQATVFDLQRLMDGIRVHEKVGLPCPLRHGLYRRYREAILDRTDEQRERQARKSQYPTLPPLAWGKEKS